MLTGEPPFVDDDPMGIYQKILGNKLLFPKGYDKAAKSLTKKFLTADLTKRYGCLKNGSLDVKKSKWLKDLDWTKLEQKKLVAPIIPEVSSDNDTSNFEEYSDSEIEAVAPKILGSDPFEDF